MGLKINNKNTMNLYCYFFVGITLLSFVICFINILCFGTTSIWLDVFFKRGNDIFADFSNNVGYSANLNPYDETYGYGYNERVYPPFTYLLMYCFSKVVNISDYIKKDSFVLMYRNPHLLITFTIVMVIGTLLAYEMFRKLKNGSDLVKSFFSIAMILSYPYIFAFERGNTIIVSMILSTFFLFNYDNKNIIIKELSLIALAMSASIKMPTAILGVILVYDKHWKDAVRTVIYGILVFFVPFLFMKGGFDNIILLLRNIELNYDKYDFGSGLTLTGCINGLILFEGGDKFIATMQVITIIYTIIVLLGSFFSDKQWYKICALSLLAILAPKHSEYYCLIYLFPAYVAFFNKEKEENYDIIVLLGFIITTVFVPFKIYKNIGLCVLATYFLITSMGNIINYTKNRILLK
ncbi:MAG: glycosyltransferase 87 family protein [Saccharofermentans sp.]|nr:glycosyltransferase 87 family protein [Saccharofermentans sp.]